MENNTGYTMFRYFNGTNHGDLGELEFYGVPAPVPTHMPGDITNDERVNNKDLVRLFQYLSGWDVEVNEDALDVNGDTRVNNKDLVRLFQFLSGWDVTIY